MLYRSLAGFLIISSIAISATAQISKAELVGVWQTGGSSMLVERNTVTGATTPSNGNILKFEFAANGQFTFIGYLQSTMYGCRTDLFNDKRGRYEVVGDHLKLTLAKNYWKNTYSCSPASNKERNYTLTPESYALRTKADESGNLYVCLTNNQNEVCYRRVNE